MALSNPKILFGIHSVTPFSRADGTPYQLLKIVESSDLSLSGKHVDLYAGSNHYAVASEVGEITTEIGLKVSQMESPMFTLFFGVTPTDTTSETSGNCTTAANVKGTSIVAAAGLASVGVLSGSKANLKFGRYVIKAVTSTTLAVFCMSDIDFNRGSAETYATDSLDVSSASLGTTITITSTMATNVTTLGLVFTGGASSTTFVVGDTAFFEVRPINSAATVVKVGGADDVFPEFSALMMAQRRGSDELAEVVAWRCKSGGMPINFSRFAFNNVDIKLKMLYDQAQNGVFQYRFVRV